MISVAQLLLAFLSAPQTMPEAGAAPPNPARDEPEGRFFRRTIDFWRTGARKEVRPPGEVEAPQGVRESVWAEPIRQPDGRYAVYVPPKAVLDFLENPTPENLKGYLDWKRERSEKLRKAIGLLEDFRAREETARSSKDPAPEPGVRLGNTEAEGKALSKAAEGAPGRTPSPVPVETGPLRLTYFHGKGCPHCAKQDGVLAEWLARHPEATLRVLELGESPELWRKYRVRGTPSLLVGFETGDLGVLLEGLSDASRLDRALATLRSAGRQPPAAPVREGAPWPKPRPEEKE